MKSIFGIVFSTLLLFESLLPNQGLLSILQSPEVYEHYQEHWRESKGQIGILEFLQMHYSPDSAHKKCPNHAHHLPVLDFSSVVNLFVTTDFTIAFSAKKITFIEPKSTFRWLNLYEFLPTHSLILPPRRYS